LADLPDKPRPRRKKARPPDETPAPIPRLETGDHVTECPYPEGHPLKLIWEAPTTEAAIHTQRLRSTLLRTSIHDITSRLKWLYDKATGEFHIWSWRNLQLVTDNASVAAFRATLTNIVVEWLQIVEEALSADGTSNRILI
jgi:hypothetical protein